MTAIEIYLLILNCLLYGSVIATALFAAYMVVWEVLHRRAYRRMGINRLPR